VQLSNESVEDSTGATSGCTSAPVSCNASLGDAQAPGPRLVGPGAGRPAHLAGEAGPVGEPDARRTGPSAADSPRGLSRGRPGARRRERLLRVTKFNPARGPAQDSRAPHGTIPTSGIRLTPLALLQGHLIVWRRRRHSVTALVSSSVRYAIPRRLACLAFALRSI
jgi:hypothetical protein